ncbi:PREDICTED: uncharacterized protein LOC108660702 [Theobroma cacao]|uniref:Uncharacterized protein LOC108660702 n=1 Tax=Theobroma cacao TaxID=3641 RepID=A0AB32VYI8_THECC|nr:PREDICTED: uncharacterized protein LOC108660702 [Theobroma cacao]
MQGEWKGLRALFFKKCPFAYYIHCFARRLQLILVAACKNVIPIEHFFSHLALNINVVDSFAKRKDHLQIAGTIEIVELVSTDELEIGKGKNQVGSLKRAGDTQWGSHVRSLRSLLDLWNLTLKVLSEIINEEILEKADNLCGLLQHKSQDIVNAMNLATTTKKVIQNFRDNGYDVLFQEVEYFCEKHEIEILDMNGPHQSSRGRVLKGQQILMMHHYRIDLFIGIIDLGLQEMNSRITEDIMELLVLSSSLDPKYGFKLFKIDDICKLVQKFNPYDFTHPEKLHIYEI